MKILIVGGAGYLGGGLTDFMLKTKHDFLVYDALLYEDTYRKKVPFVWGDIRDHSKLKKYLDWADVVVWLAAIVGDPACGLRDSLTNEINRDSVAYLRENFKGRIIFMSTCSVYGAGEKILDETSDVNPLSLYARTKLAAEKILAGSNAVCFRLGTLFGLSDEFARVRFDLVVNTLVMRAIFHGKITVFGGEQFRPMLHVRDVGPAIILALDKPDTGIYNLHFQNYTIVEMASRIKKVFPDLVIESTGEQFQDNRNYSVSSEKAKKAFGFNPVVSLEEGIKEIKELLEQNRVKNTFISRFSNYQYLRNLMEEHPSILGKEIKLNV
jgi:nucleoside-diphosphate-sugar epimerase